jgi:hypothetical protein
MKAVILNSTGHRPHFGCKLVWSAYQRLLEERDIELIGYWPKRTKLGHIRRTCDKADIVILNAEGSIHHGNNEDLLRIAERYPSVLINGSMQELSNDAASYLRQFKMLHVREGLTQEYLYNHHGVQAQVTPDVIFYHAGG